MIPAGKTVAQALWKLIRNNFISHEDRITELETQGSLFNAGFMFDYAGSSAPTGWLLCDGSVISRTTYADLFAIIGTTYNTGGEAGTHFRLPDLRGRASLGAGTGASPALTARTHAATGGAESHQLTTAEMPSHSHTISETPHTHATGFTAGSGVDALPTNANAATTPTITTNYATSGYSVGNRGGDTAHNNMQPSIVMNVIIKV